ncbi:hypothetical protein Tco_1041382 [Tanacetum coccineum]|uniref:Uncharacterized protein n=1 Tax=Tanacetum coccineum TaxID=301880 RepID=A0ABQ5GG01_9ASTR
MVTLFYAPGNCHLYPSLRKSTLAYTVVWVLDYVDHCPEQQQSSYHSESPFPYCHPIPPSIMESLISAPRLEIGSISLMLALVLGFHGKLLEVFYLNSFQFEGSKHYGCEVEVMGWGLGGVTELLPSGARFCTNMDSKSEVTFPE